MAKVLITSALPYINGVKHLGNLAGSLLPADIHARYRRQIGDHVLFICATDEHGTPAELAAADCGVPVSDYCDGQHDIQKAVYAGLNLSFDHFGRSSCRQNRTLTQDFFLALEANGLIDERTIEQVYCVDDSRFLPDRYIVGTCPHCGSTGARGDQCESCTRPLDPTDLIDPRSVISGSVRLERRATRHLFLRQSALVEELTAWIDSRSGWPALVTSIARKWLSEGIQDRCITRDLAWGVPVPKPGFEDKVFYVWFDAPIAYIAATQEWAEADPIRRDWRAWWLDEATQYLQFLGKDNVPFHAISFPCTLLGARQGWKTVDVIKGVHWLTYRGGKFSTSEHRGVFLDQALDLLPADCWRWWLAANAPEGGDADFTFGRFVADVNSDLANTLGNLANRLLTFVATRYGGILPAGGIAGEAEAQLIEELDHRLAALRSHHDALSIRKAVGETRAIWALANAYAANQAPWTIVKTDPDRAAVALRHAIHLLYVSAIVAWPFIPAAAECILQALAQPGVQPAWPRSAAAALAHIPPGTTLAVIPPLFTKLTDAWRIEQEERFGGVS